MKISDYQLFSLKIPVCVDKHNLLLCYQRKVRPLETLENTIYTEDLETANYEFLNANYEFLNVFLPIQLQGNP